MATLSGHTDWVKGVAAAPGYIITGSKGGFVKVHRGDASFELARSIEDRSDRAHTGHVYGLAVLQGRRRRFVSVSDDKSIQVRTLDGDLGNHRGLYGNCWVGSRVYCVAALPDSERFVVGLDNKEVRLYEYSGSAETQRIHTFKGHTNSVLAVAVTPDGQHIISGSADAFVNVWSVATKSLVSTCKGHTSRVNAVVAMPDGQRILSGGSDKTIRVWLINGTRENTFKLHASHVHALVALRNHQHVLDGREQHALSGSADHTIKLFNVNDGTIVRTFTHHTDWVNCLALLPDGLRFVSGSDDKTAHIAYHGLAP